MPHILYDESSKNGVPGFPGVKSGKKNSGPERTRKPEALVPKGLWNFLHLLKTVLIYYLA
jgi:hypothetical protein